MSAPVMFLLSHEFKGIRSDSAHMVCAQSSPWPLPQSNAATQHKSRHSAFLRKASGRAVFLGDEARFEVKMAGCQLNRARANVGLVLGVASTG
jgi:hypothetical protein